MNMSQQSFSAMFQELRKAKRITLRAFCEKAEADPGNISRMERGGMPPPQDRDILSRYAKALKISEGSDEWYLFFDLAAVGLCYGCSFGGDCWQECENADLNSDGKIDIFDLATVGLNYGKSC